MRFNVFHNWGRCNAGYKFRDYTKSYGRFKKIQEYMLLAKEEYSRYGYPRFTWGYFGVKSGI